MPVKVTKGVLPKSSLYNESEKGKQKKNIPIKSSITKIEYKIQPEKNAKEVIKEAKDFKGVIMSKEKIQERIPKMKNK